MSDTMDDIFSDKDKGQTVKSNEITGDRFPFHSLPKEFQDWHNVYYILEKQSPLDKNAVSRAIYNGYMWKTILDASLYAILMTTTILGFAVKFKIEFNLIWFLISFFIASATLSWIAYHFIFYAMIRSQIVGEVTALSAKYTTFTFYSSFFGITTSLIIMFLYAVYFFQASLSSYFELVANIYYKYPENYGIMQNVKEILIFIHNLLARLISSEGNIFDNLYLITIMAMLTSYGVIYIVETATYRKRKKEIDFEVEKTKQAQGYAVETSQRIMEQWRKKQ